MAGNKSEQIRQMWKSGLSVNEISKLMGIRYQYVYNVVSWYVKQLEMEEKKNDSRDSGGFTLRVSV